MMLPRSARLNRPREFAQVYRQGRQVQSPHLRLFFLVTGQNASRFGFVVSKKQVQKIVLRNRVKRILRSRTQNLLPFLRPGFDVVTMPKAGVENPDLKKLSWELGELLQKAKLLKPL